MHDPRLLIFETSGRRCQIAVARGGQLLAQRALDEARRNARDLAPTVQALLREQGWTARCLDGVLVSRGPGSYTGLRVGIMSAKSLAFATGCALIAVDTFAAVATQALPVCVRLDVLGDAQKDSVYLQPFRRVGGAWSAGELRIVAFAEWLAQRDADAWVGGPGLAKYGSRVPDAVPRLPQELWEPLAESVLTLGLRRWLTGERDAVLTVEPLYLRASSAEEQWDARGGPR